MSPSMFEERYGRTAVGHVRGRRRRDCAIATLAMVADVPYEEVVDRCGIGPEDRGVSIRQMRGFLETMTGTRWKIRWHLFLRRIYQTRGPGELTVYVIKRPWRQRYHALAAQGPWIHDPAFRETRTREEHPWRHWRIVATLEPVCPEAVAALRRRAAFRWVPGRN